MQQIKKIPISKAKEIAQFGYDEVIIVGCQYADGIQHVTTYGKSQAACENAAIGGNEVKKLLKWPEEMCNAKPPRQKKNEKMGKLEKLLKYSNKYEINIQFWPNQTAVFIAKDGVDLQDYGGDFDFAIDSATEYLDRITKK